MKFRVLGSLLLSVVVPTLLFSCTVHFSLEILKAHQAADEIATTSKTIMSRLNILGQYVRDAGIAFGGYSMTKSDLFLDRLNRLYDKVPEEVTALKALPASSPNQRGLIEQAEKISNEAIQVIKSAKADIRDKKMDVQNLQSRAFYKRIRDCADRIQTLSQEAAAEGLQFQMDQQQLSRLNENAYFYCGAAALSFLLSIGSSLLLSSSAPSKRTLVLLFGILPVMPLLIVFWLVGSSLKQALEEATVETKSQTRNLRMLYTANEISIMFNNAGVAMGGYSITKSQMFSSKSDQSIDNAAKLIDQLQLELKDDPTGLKKLKKVKDMFGETAKMLHEVRDIINDNRVDVAQFRARHMYKDIRSLSDDLRNYLSSLTEDARRIKNVDPEQYSKFSFNVISAASAAVLLAIILTFFSSMQICSALQSKNPGTADGG